MDIKPVKNYKTPKYPEKEEILKNPDLLKTLPERWKGSIYAAAALSSLMLMILTSCTQQKVKNGEEYAAGRIVPIFIHGDGRGSYGCVSVAPPAFLSEEEAFSVITEEARREGIVFERQAPILKDVTIPETDLNYHQDKEENMKSQKGNLTLDGYDKSRNIAFEFVSKDDISLWANKNGPISSVETYEFLDAARVVSEGIKNKTGDMTVATFYDPHYNFNSEEVQEIIKESNYDYDSMEEKIKEFVKADLREQVKDFLSWLKAQGII